MCDCADEVRLKNILSHEVHVTSRCDDETVRSMCRAHKCNSRVSMFVYLCLLMQFVSCLLSSSLVLIFML